MNYLTLLKRFDKAIVSENKRLNAIYSKLIREAKDEDIEEEEEKCPDCGKSPCECESKEKIEETGNGTDGETLDHEIDAKKFFESEDDESSEEETEVDDESSEEIEEIDDESDEETEETDDKIDEDAPKGKPEDAAKFFSKESSADEPPAKEPVDEESPADEPAEKIDEEDVKLVPFSSIFEDESSSDEPKKEPVGEEASVEIDEASSPEDDSSAEKEESSPEDESSAEEVTNESIAKFVKKNKRLFKGA